MLKKKKNKEKDTRKKEKKKKKKNKKLTIYVENIKHSINKRLVCFMSVCVSGHHI